MPLSDCRVTKLPWEAGELAQNYIDNQPQLPEHKGGYTLVREGLSVYVAVRWSLEKSAPPLQKTSCTVTKFVSFIQVCPEFFFFLLADNKGAEYKTCLFSHLRQEQLKGPAKVHVIKK